MSLTGNYNLSNIPAIPTVIGNCQFNTGNNAQNNFRIIKRKKIKFFHFLFFFLTRMNELKMNERMQNFKSNF